MDKQNIVLPKEKNISHKEEWNSHVSLSLFTQWRIDYVMMVPMGYPIQPRYTVGYTN